MHDAILRTGFLIQTRGYLRLIGIAVRDAYVHAHTPPLCASVFAQKSLPLLSDSRVTVKKHASARVSRVSLYWCRGKIYVDFNCNVLLIHSFITEA